MRTLKSGSSMRKCLPQLRKASMRWCSRRSLAIVVLPSTRAIVLPVKRVASSLRMTIEGPSGIPLICWPDPIPRSLCNAMQKKGHVSETPATAFLKANGVAFTEHPYEYLEHGGAQHSAAVLGFDPFTVVK